MLRGTASNFVGQAAVLVVGLVLTPFILHRIGIRAYGLWAVATSVAGYGRVLDLGISNAVIKYVAEHRARGESREASAFVATALRLYVLLAAVALALAAGVALILPRFLDLDRGQHRLASWLIALAGLGLALGFPCGIVTAVLTALQRFELINLLTIATSLMTALASVIVLVLGGGVIALLAVGIAVMLAMQVPGLWLMRRAAPDLALGLAGASRALARRMLSFGSPTAGIQLAGMLSSRVDPLVIGAARSAAAVTPYVLAQRLARLVALLATQFVEVMFPIASELRAHDDPATLRRLYVTSTRLTLAAALPAAVAVSILAPSILSIWVGADFARYGDLTAILAANAVVDTMLWPGLIVLMAAERHRPLAFMAIGCGIANLVLSIVLVRPFGLVGVALGTLIPTAVEAAFFFLPYVLRTLDVTLAHLVREVYLRVVPAALALTAILVLGRVLVDSPSGAELLGVVAAGGVVYVSLYVAIGATAEERRFYGALAASTARHAGLPLRRSRPSG